MFRLTAKPLMSKKNHINFPQLIRKIFLKILSLSALMIKVTSFWRPVLVYGSASLSYGGVMHFGAQLMFPFRDIKNSKTTVTVCWDAGTIIQMMMPKMPMVFNRIWTCTHGLLEIAGVCSRRPLVKSKCFVCAHNYSTVYNTPCMQCTIICCKYMLNKFILILQGYSQGDKEP